MDAQLHTSLTRAATAPGFDETLPRRSIINRDTLVADTL
jgi:hypothetical protein